MTQTYKPTILCTAGNAATEADEAETILLEHAKRLQIFDRVGLVVRIITLREPRVSGGLSRPIGTVLIEPVSRVMMSETFERFIDFQKPVSKGARQIDCPSRVVDYYLSRTGSRRLPVLVGTALAPFMRPDGVVIDSPGFDEDTGSFLVSDEKWLPVADAPTKEDALEALVTLRKPFDQFPFVSLADFSVHLAALLTVIQRRLLPFAPLIGYSAPMPRTGKSALADSVSIVGTGRHAPCQVVSHEREEFRKVIFTTLLEGHAIVNLDNVERPLESEPLNIALTQPTFKDRILGQSREFCLPTRTMWTATGNNLAFRGDLTVRVLICHIDAEREHPEEREFTIRDLPQYLREHRAELVHAILTILRAYHVAGCPEQTMKPWAGFDDWSRTIRAPLLWLGLADPIETRESVTQDAPDHEAAVNLLTALDSAYGGGTFTLAKAIQLSKQADHVDLEDAFKAIASEKGQIDRKGVQYWFRRWKGKYAGGLKLRDTGKTDNVVRWRIENQNGTPKSCEVETNDELLPMVEDPEAS